MSIHDIELPPLPSPFGIVDPMGSGEKIYTLKDMGDYARAYALAAIEPYAKRIAQLEAARFAYASEFPPNEDGDPDVGSIHENIRKLKTELEADRKRRGEPGLLMVQEADTIPHFHPEYGPGIFFTEDAVISPRAQQPAEPDSAKCAECGAELIPVRPGKWQHPDCSQSYWAAEPGGYVHTVSDDCETLHWRGQILSLNELAMISADPVKVPSSFPAGTEYSVEPHGNGYTIYQGRDQFHHGLNLAYLTECTPEFSKRIESALNAMSESVKVPSDAEIGHILKEVLHNSRYGVHQWELWLEFASALFTRCTHAAHQGGQQ